MNEQSYVVPLKTQTKQEIYECYLELQNYINRYFAYGQGNPAKKKGLKKHIWYAYKEFMKLIIDEHNLKILRDKQAEAFLRQHYYSFKNNLSEVDINIIASLCTTIVNRFGLTDFKTQSISLKDKENYLTENDDE